jgi:cyclase
LAGARGKCLVMLVGALAASWLLFEPSRLARAQQSGGALEVLRVRPDFYMIAGAGGNIGVQAGPDGSVVVDAGALDASDRVIAAIQKLNDQPIRYIVNTGPDSDHVGGNGKLSKAGRSVFAMGPEPVGGEFTKTMTNGFAASILAAEPVLLRISAPSGTNPALPTDTWPTETFTESRRTIYFNHEGIEVLRQPSAHSDGDSLVYFRASDVIAAGDILDTTRFPVIDLEKGGSIQGEIDALNRIISISVRPMPLVYQDAGTYILPGHGRICSQSDVVDYRDMVVIIRDVIQDMLGRGMTLAQVQAAEPAKGYATRYGAKTGAWTTNDFVAAVYKSLQNQPKGREK